MTRCHPFRRWTLTGLFIGCLMPVNLAVHAQPQHRPVAATDSLVFEVGTRAVLGTSDWAPFLTAANAYDRHSITANNLTLWGALAKPVRAHRFVDYGFGAEVDLNLSPDEQRLFPGEVYAQAKWWRLVFTGGMKRAVYGNQDPLLSAGGTLWSRNARPMPRLSLESMGYIPVPLTAGLIEVNGGLTHGWFSDKTVTKHTLLHYKYAGVRLGGHWPVRLNYTLHHVAQWAGTSPVYGVSPVTWDNYKRVLLGRSGDEQAPATERFNTLGNHIISKNLGLDLRFPTFELALYWQNLYEDKPVNLMYKAYNRKDGLFGLSLLLPRTKPLNRLVLEFLSTTDQSGPWHDLDGVIYGGRDSYYNNGVYPNGWSFYGMTQGNPWLTSPRYNPGYDPDQGLNVGIKNNRVRLYHLAGQGRFGTWNYQVTLAYSDNYGLSGQPYIRKEQLSWFLDVATPFRFLPQTEMTAGCAGDLGRQYGNNLALAVGLRWRGALSW